MKRPLRFGKRYTLCRNMRAVPSFPQKQLSKTALGSEETVTWNYSRNGLDFVGDLRARGHEIAAIETSAQSIDLFDWHPRFPVCVLFGHEVDGLSPEALQLADTHIRIPMLGTKHSLNVATAGGIVIFELLRKYRALGKASPTFGRG